MPRMTHVSAALLYPAHMLTTVLWKVPQGTPVSGRDNPHPHCMIDGLRWDYWYRLHKREVTLFRGRTAVKVL